MWNSFHRTFDKEQRFGRTRDTRPSSHVSRHIAHYSRVLFQWRNLIYRDGIREFKLLPYDSCLPMTEFTRYVKPLKPSSWGLCFNPKVLTRSKKGPYVSLPPNMIKNPVQDILNRSHELLCCTILLDMSRSAFKKLCIVRLTSIGHMICGRISTDDQILYKCVLAVGNEDPSLINPVFASRPNGTGFPTHSIMQCVVRCL